MSDHKGHASAPQFDRGHASAHQFKRVLVDSDGETMRSANFVDEASEQREICCAFFKSPHIPIAGASAVSAL